MLVLQTTNLSNKYFQQHLEDALTNGQPLIIEDITEELDPALNNVLEKNFIKIGTGLKVFLIFASPNFYRNTLSLNLSFATVIILLFVV